MHVLRLEAIGHMARQRDRAAMARSGRVLPGSYRATYSPDSTDGSCSRVVGVVPLRLEQIQPMRDYANVAAGGNRGIMMLYFLGRGVYRVERRRGWSAVDRYFLAVDTLGAKRVSSDEVGEWFARLG